MISDHGYYGSKPHMQSGSIEMMRRKNKGSAGQNPVLSPLLSNELYEKEPAPIFYFIHQLQLFSERNSG